MLKVLYFFLLLWGICFGGEVRLEDGAPVVEIVIHNWVLPDASRSDPMSRAHLAVVRAFKERYPEIVQERYRERYEADPQKYGNYDWSKVQVLCRKFTGIKVEGVESDLLAIAGGVAPDVMYMNFRRTDTYIRQGFLAPLDAYMDQLTEEEIEDRIHEKVWPVIRRPGPKGETHIWALPYGGLMGKGLLFRKDRFEEAGLAYPDATWTWEDLLSASRKLTDPGQGRYAVRLVRGNDESYHFMTFLWSAGGAFMTMDPETGEWSLAYDSPEAAAALDFYLTMTTEPWVDAQGVPRRGYAYQDVAGAWGKWQRGEIAMTQGYMDEEMFNVINPELTGLAPMPLGPTGIRGSEINNRMLSLFRDIQDPVVRDASWEFIRFFGSKEAQEIRTRILVKAGLARFIFPDRLEEFGYHALVKLSPPGWTDVFKISIESGTPEPYGPNSNIAYTQLSLPLQEARELAVKEALPEDKQERLLLLQEMLATSAERAEREMLGHLPEDEIRPKRRVALGVIGLIVLAYTVMIRVIVKSYAQASQEAGSVASRRNGVWVALLLGPALGAVTLWQVIPLFRGSLMAFQEYNLMDPSPWVGLQNFAEVLFDSAWWESVWAAVRYTFWVMGLTFLPPLLLAILLQETPWGKLFFRVVYYLPAVVSGLVVILMWKLFYEESEVGLLNAVVMQIPAIAYLGVGGLFAGLCVGLATRLLRQSSTLFALLSLFASVACAWTGWQLASEIFSQHQGFALFSTLVEPVRWLSSPETAMFACVLPLAWAGMGPGCLIYLAALKGIDEESYEAAEIDGAGFLDKVLFIVIPRLKPLLLINFIGVFISAFFHAEANVLAMTGGGADTNVAGLHIFRQAYIYLRFGPATAMAWLLGVMLIGFTLWQLRMLVKLEFKTTGDD
ncbi:extracellular solute-binding protein [Kiritimatiellota bacterium B12222]|nr:extracellular solute-binding protein [Kiritimatiellota bacterium B12222]